MKIVTDEPEGGHEHNEEGQTTSHKLAQEQAVYGFPELF